jgi:hypothetical protein
MMVQAPVSARLPKAALPTGLSSAPIQAICSPKPQIHTNFVRNNWATAPL